jgi:protein-S-isoprenylcysteine O-methyltransferase Ste14
MRKMINRWVRSALTFLIGSAVIVGLPLLGWGLTDLQGYCGNPVRLSFVIAVLCLNAVAAIRIPETGKQRVREKNIVGRQHSAVLLLQILSMAVLLIGGWTDAHGVASMGDWVRLPGLLLYLAGFLTMHIVEGYLGSQFTVEVAIHEGHRLLTDGPFRHVRHPRYAGIILFSTGIALVFRSWIAIGVTLLIVVVLLWRIRDEEALMRGEFGDRWDAYCGRTARLIPGLY